MNKYDKPGKMYIFTQIPKYRTTVSPLISDNNKKAIEDKLQNEKLSKAATQKRVSKNDYFINYHRNPFDSAKTKPHKYSDSIAAYQTSATSLRKSEKIKEISIINEIDDLKKQQKIQDKIKRKNYKSLSPLLNTTNNLMMKTLGKLKKQQLSPKFDMKKFKIKEEAKEKEQKSQKQLLKGKKIIKKVMPNNQQSSQSALKNLMMIMHDAKQKSQSKTSYKIPKGLVDLDLDEIMNIREDNYFIKGKDFAFNVFNIPYNDQQILSGAQRLKQKNFSFDSISNVSTKLKLDTFRELSAIGRKIIDSNQPITRQITETFSSDELIFNLNNLNFMDIMNLSSGRFTSEFTSSMIENEEVTTGQKKLSSKQSDNSLSSEEQQLRAIAYPQKTENQKDNWCGNQEETLEVDQFRKGEYTTAQQKLSGKYQGLIDRLGQMLSQRNQIVSNCIFDKKIHKLNSGRIEQKMSSFVNQQRNNRIISQMENDRFIRKNKNTKNKFQTVRYTKTLTALELLHRKNRQISANKNIFEQ